METSLKVLILEDSATDADLIKRLIKKENKDAEFNIAMDQESFTQALDDFSPDIILADNSLPNFDGSAALNLTCHRSTHIPFILVTGTVSEEFAATIIKQGADDYILKDRIARLPSAIAAAIKQKCTDNEKQETVTRLKENEKKYRELVERVSDCFIALDLSWQFTYANKKAEELFNKPMSYLLGKNIWDELNVSDVAILKPQYEQALNYVKNHHFKEFSNSFNKWIDTSIYPSDTGISVYIKDITAQHESDENLKLLEIKIEDQKVQEQKRTVRAIINTQENERNHLAKELHDNINQILTGAKIYLNLAGNKNEELKELIKYPNELIDMSIKEIRLLCQKMGAPTKDFALNELIENLIAIFKKNNESINIAFEYDVDPEILFDELKINILRVVQEQINNIFKYAEAKNISISIKEANKIIAISVVDDGKGYDTSVKRTGLGVSNMINRIESFNGKIEIVSAIGAGCKTYIQIPVGRE
ncbi:MAG: response regulator [Bacteroidetes bacterium]|nr:response regulator [Bacteroidota bacterium]